MICDIICVNRRELNNLGQASFIMFYSMFAVNKSVNKIYTLYFVVYVLYDILFSDCDHILQLF